MLNNLSLVQCYCINCNLINIYWLQIQLLINQAFGSPLQGLPTSPLDLAGSDSESMASTPDDGGFTTICQKLEAESVLTDSPDTSKGNNVSKHD